MLKFNLLWLALVLVLVAIFWQFKDQPARLPLSAWTTIFGVK